MDFSEKLVNKIHTHRINPVIVFIILSITATALVAGLATGPDLDYSKVIAITLSASLLFVTIIARHVFNLQNHALGKIEDFVILNSDSINKSVNHHEKMLSIVTNLDISSSMLKSDNVIKKFQTFLTD